MHRQPCISLSTDTQPDCTTTQGTGTITYMLPVTDMC